jgi:hypothetical protein
MMGYGIVMPAVSELVTYFSRSTNLFNSILKTFSAVPAYKKSAKEVCGHIILTSWK